MKTDIRGKRRMARERFVRRAKKLYPENKCPQKYADNRTPCSCSSCQNQRRSEWAKGERLTLQERRAKDATLHP